MFKNKLAILCLVTIVVIIAATFFVNLRAPQTEKEKIAFFPGLSDQTETVNHISIKSQTESVNLSRNNDSWTIDEFDGYPVLEDKVKSTVLGTADLKINAAKTALPRLYHRLGVEGLEVEDSTSLLLTLQDKDGNNIVDIIVGKPRRSSAAENSPGLYIRKSGDAQSYLVDGMLDITAIKKNWIEKTLFDIPAEAIQSIRIDHSDGDTFTILKKEQEQNNFELENLPYGKKVASKYIIDQFGSLLQDMQIRGARAKEKLIEPTNSTRIRVTSFAGVVANIITFRLDDIPYASFEFSHDISLLQTDKAKEEFDDAKAFASSLNAHTANWWFEIPEFKYDLFKKRLDSLLRDIDTAQKDSE